MAEDLSRTEAGRPRPIAGDAGDRRAVLTFIVRAARKLLDGAGAGIALRDPARGGYAVEASDGLLEGITFVPDASAFLLHRIVETRSVLRLDQYQANELALPELVTRGVDSILAAPIFRDGAAIGALGVLRGPGSVFQPADEEVIELLAHMATVGLSSAEQQAGGARRLARLDAVQGLMKELVELDDRRAVLERALDATTTVLGADRAAIFLAPDSRGPEVPQLACEASRGISQRYLSAVAERCQRTVHAAVLQTRKPVFIADVPTDLRTRAIHAEAREEGIHSVLVVPLVARRRVLGIFSLYHNLRWSYSEDELALIQAVAGQVAAALANVAFFEQYEEQLRRVEALVEVGRATAGCRDLATGCARMVKAAERLPGVEWAALYLGSQRESLRPAAASEARIEATPREGTPPAPFAPPGGVASGCEEIVPLLDGEAMLGILRCVRSGVAPFTPAERELIQAAARPIAAALASLRLAADVATERHRLAAVVEALPDGILVYDSDDRLVVANPRVRAMLALQNRSMIGWTPLDLFGAIRPLLADPTSADRLLRQAAGERLCPHREELELRQRPIRFVERISLPLHETNGDFLGQVVHYRDITSEREGQEPRGASASGPLAERGATAPRILLASASPRRLDLLARAGFTIEVHPSAVDETPAFGEAPPAYVARVASSKARAAQAANAGWERRCAVLLAADTIVTLDESILGKPGNATEARAMLERLSGRSHFVLTHFVILAAAGTARARTIASEVELRTLAPEEIDEYLEGGEWRDKAGGYAIQGLAAAFVRTVRGSYTNVVGLPLSEVCEELAQLGVTRFPAPRHA